MGRSFMIAGDSYPPIRQAAVIIQTSKEKSTAKAFLAYLKRPEIVALMEEVRIRGAKRP